MAITKQKKIELTSELGDLLKGKESITFVKFKKLSVGETTKLRRVLREAGVSYKVAKKTLLKRVLDAQGYEGTIPELEGEVAVAFSHDLIAPAREVYGFAKDHKEEVQIVGGVFEGKYMSKEAMLSIATIPSMQTLRAQFVNLINSPIQQLVVGLNAIADKKSA